LPALLNPVVETEVNDTLDRGHDLGNLSDAGRADAIGVVGNSPAEAADVDWYTFTLTRPGAVTLAAVGLQVGPAMGRVITLYNSANDVFDLYVPNGHRLVDQDEGTEACLHQVLAAGTYHVAISGAGNRFFHPFLENSGSEGITGDYRLHLAVTDVAVQPGDGPAILSVNPASNSSLNGSPFVLRLGTTSTLDPNTLIPDVTVQLTYNPTGTFGDGNDQQILVQPTFSAAANELQFLPLSPITYMPVPLAPGHYRIFLAGDTTSWGSVVTDLNGVPLGANASNPSGRDYITTFQITGTEGHPGSSAPADDTPATANNLGDVTRAGVVRAEGAIGDDPAYNPANADPNLTNPAADVDHYRFRITGAGRYAVIIEVAAGRLGNNFFDPAVSLYRVNPADGQLILVVANDNTLNPIQAADGSQPLYADAVVFAGLEAGEYFAVVSGGTNVPDVPGGLLPGTNGIYDPNVSHSGLNGYSVGEYVLSLIVHRDEEGPKVEAASLEGVTFTTAPTHFSVRFNESVNIQHLAFQEGLLTQTGELAPIFIRGSDGTDYHPRFLSYDPTTNEARFLMIDRLPNGVNELHLSGALGLTDLAGNQLVGNNPNDPTADFVASFTVNAPVPGSNGNPRIWLNNEPNDSLSQPQELGVLFPRELQAGVIVKRNFTSNPSLAPSDTADFYRFEVLQSRGYFFTLINTGGLPVGTRPQIFTAAGAPVFTTGGTVRLANLQPGVYYVRVGGWTTAQAANARYDLRITMGSSNENPTALTSGPAPAYRIRFRDPVTPPVVPPTPGPTTNGNTGGGGTSSPGNLVNMPTDSTGNPRIQLTNSGNSSGVVPAFLAETNQSFVSGGVFSDGLGLLSEGPIGGVRGTGPEGGNSQLRLVLPGSGGNSRDDLIRLVNAEQLGLGGTLADRFFDAFSRFLQNVGQGVLQGSRGSEELVEWLSWWLDQFWGMNESSFHEENSEESEAEVIEATDTEVFANGWENSNQTPPDLLWAAGLLAAGGLTACFRDKSRNHPEWSPALAEMNTSV
jgi:hypothetical protein